MLVSKWTDRRLNTSALRASQTFVVTQSPDVARFWTPELYLTNALNAHVVSALQLVQKLTVNREGEVTYAMRLHTRFMCTMNLQNFPHDYQICPLMVSSCELRFEEEVFGGV